MYKQINNLGLNLIGILEDLYCMVMDFVRIKIKENIYNFFLIIFSQINILLAINCLLTYLAEMLPSFINDHSESSDIKLKIIKLIGFIPRIPDHGAEHIQ